MKKIILSYWIFLLCAGGAFSQTACDEKEKNTLDDPIVAMLDSLVSINFMSHYDYSEAQKAIHVPECKSYTAEEFKAKMKLLQSPIPLDYNESVKAYIDLYSYRKAWITSRVLGLSQLYFPMFEQVLDQLDLPLEFKYLAVVESALNPMAVSKAGATGIWQFMYTTGKMYGLKVTSYIDERKDPYKATVAACQYFKNMYAIYHDWLLVIAAYNCGERNVNKAILRAGGRTNFWEIRKYLPMETRGYVPAFIAVSYVMNYASDYNIPVVPPLITYFETDTVTVNQQVMISQIASVIDVPLDELRFLNPIFKKNLIPYTGEETYRILLPSNKTSAFITNADKIYQAMQDNTKGDTITYEYLTREVKQYHKVKKGEGLASIAKKYDCEMSDIKEWNKLKSFRVRSGQKLVLFVTVTQKVEKIVSPNPKQTTTVQDTTTVSTEPSVATPKKKAEVKYVYHTVQPGDTLYSIAQKYQATVEQLKEINKIKSPANLVPGMKLKIMVNG